MKKALIILFVLVVGVHVCYGQSSSSSSKVTIGTSYTNSSSYVIVYPCQSGTQIKIDKSVHFKLNINTRFKINDVKDSAGTIQGYVITPWKYKDSVFKTKKDTAESKNAFYASVRNSSKKRITAQRLKDSILKQKTALKSVTKTLQQDSLKIKSATDSVNKLNKIVKSNSKQLLVKTISIDPKKLYPTTNSDEIKKKLKAFTKLQKTANAHLKNGTEPDSTFKNDLLSTFSSLTIKNGKYNYYVKAYANSNNRLKNANRALQDANENFNDANDSITQVKSYLTDLTHQYSNLVKQINNNITDPYAFKITKEKINDTLDTPADTTNQAAYFDDLAYVDSWANGWLFFISAKDFSDHCVMIYPKSDQFTWGFLTLPIKMRFDNSRSGRFDFEQNLNFGLTFGDKHQLTSTNDVSLNYLAGLSVVNVPLNNATPATSTNAATSSTSTAAVSTSIGLMVQYDKFQMGVFLGRDFAGSHANQFAYQGKPWLGFAIGVSLFGEGKTTSSSETQDSGKP